MELTAIGIVDATARPINRPGDRLQNFYNGRKAAAVVNHQMVTLIDGTVVHLHSGNPGAHHDSWVWNMNPLYYDCDRLFSDEDYLLADSAYQACNHTLSQLRVVGPDAEARPNFNALIGHTRVAVEHAF